MSQFNAFRSRKIRLVEPGWETFSDFFGSVQFQDGVSVDAVSWVDQQRLGGLVRIESADEDDAGAEIGPGAEVLRSKSFIATDEQLAAADQVIMVDGQVRLVATTFTREELESIADKRGLQGLRDIAVRYGLKGRSIPDMINSILDAEGRGEVAPQVEQIAPAPAIASELAAPAIASELAVPEPTATLQE